MEGRAAVPTSFSGFSVRRKSAELHETSYIRSPSLWPPSVFLNNITRLTLIRQSGRL